ncbi:MULTISPECIES: phospholipase D-like domain-containing anti-phage protein [Bacillus]|uniref:phospholipase D-like domain-containing anti-phage protein n=1 Tax=Bacillus TaxID=1386 RepID=UPI001C7F6366|nr:MULTISPECIES: phospholipase D-like domain-containing anti-phage protein [Bacillus]BCC61101.1 DEAD/DEAH box helicase [Bacillus cereus]
MINRYSSRKSRLDQTFLNQKLSGAKAYDRIAGYFSSSILEIAGEALETIDGKVRVICNSGLSKEDVVTATAAKNAQRKEWCSTYPEECLNNTNGRLNKLYELLKSEKMEVKVVPDDVFGLIHGKAGVITLSDGSRTSFIGSVNETYSAWKLNYEIMWEDDSEASVTWVQEEFDYFWNSPYAVPLSEFVVEDINRIANRTVINKVEEWQQEPAPAPAVVETPVYRKEYGLWEHQKYFVDLAFNDHKKSHGARYVLADMVGLGKTVQLALSAKLMALYGEKPILIIAPKTLLWQWQEEMNNLLDMPSAVWTGKEWVDENGVKYPSVGSEGIKKCPRMVGVISQGLITANSDVIRYLLNMDYECVIVDEAHRARRKNLGEGKENDKPQPNNLMEFLLQISKKTKSMLLATATPVQLYPIEAWDLLNILSQKDDSVLGNEYSYWRTKPQRALNLIMDKENVDAHYENWDWIRNPFPPSKEDERFFGMIRKRLEMQDSEFVIKPEALNDLSRPDQRRIGRIIEDGFIQNHNPFIRHIVRRTRNFLEDTINPDTGEPYLKKVKVELLGESEDEAIMLPPYLEDAYHYAEEFSRLLGRRIKSGGFIKTLLLKRIGSTIYAGEQTAIKMLNWGITEEDLGEDESLEEIDENSIKNLNDEERQCLSNFVKAIEANKDKDPKYRLTYELLVGEDWKGKGCIIFSQFYDSVYWVANNLSNDLKNTIIGIYAGGDKSGILINGKYERKTKEQLKAMVKRRELKILLGTDAASEGLNLQTLGTLINLDLPWNPTRLEQRKGRIQRIGQLNEIVYIYNMRYKDSVEDKVHEILSERLENIHTLFGQIPDVLEDVWIQVALDEIESATRIIDEVPKHHPFELRYEKSIGKIDWESCISVLDSIETRNYLKNKW